MDFGRNLTPRLPNGVAEQKSGFSKIKNACAKAVKDCYSYIWIDTCCIDKTSSAELSEAINSMFLWYREAKICYAYLADVPANYRFDDEGLLFRRSRWFTRGWALQELIAPFEVVFLNCDWEVLKRKSEFLGLLCDITGIDALVLGGSSLHKVSIAQRMSWASKRQTTRPEDIAYCLMGIFDVNMPLLYGEGAKAFRRLQHEIIRTSDDLTIFAWKDKDAPYNKYGSDILATSPKNFSEARNLCVLPYLQRRVSIPSDVTNKGIRVGLVLVSDESDSITFKAPVAVDKNLHLERCYSIVLQRVNRHGDQYCRVGTQNLDESIGIGPNTAQFFLNRKSLVVTDTPSKCHYQSIFAIQDPAATTWFPYVRVPSSFTNASSIELREVYPCTKWDMQHNFIHIGPEDLERFLSDGFWRLAVLRYCHAPVSEERWVERNGIIVALGLKFYEDSKFELPTPEEVRKLELTSRIAKAWCIFYTPWQGERLSLKQIHESSNYDSPWRNRGDLQSSARAPLTNYIDCVGVSSATRINMRLNEKHIGGQLVYDLSLYLS